MVFLHVIPPSKRMMNTIISEIRKRFSNDRHIFYFLAKCPLSETVLFDYGDVYQMEGKSRLDKIKHFNNMAKQADYIVWHAMTYSTKHVLFFSLPRFLKKSVWVMWGIDLYNWEKPQKGFKNRIGNFLNRYWRANLKHVVSLLPTDTAYYHKLFPKSKAKIYDAQYPFSCESFATMDMLTNWFPRQTDNTYIQVANNAHPFNNHLNVLSTLERFKDENITLFLPLSYGAEPKDKDPYVRKIVSKLESSFKGRAYALKKLMPLDDYSVFMWNMDVAVFDAHRQNALGNILKQLYIGNKVFISPFSPTYKFLKDLNIDISSTQDIGKLSFEEFIKKPDPTRAREWILQEYHPENAMRKWDGLFYSLGGHSHTQSFSIELPKPSIPSVPLYKDIQTNAYKYLAWPFNIQLTKRFVIAGIEPFSYSLAQNILSLNKDPKKPLFFQIGFLCDEVEFPVASQLKNFVGTYKTYNTQPDQSILCAVEDGAERAKVFDTLQARGITPSSWICNKIVDPMKTPSNNKFGVGCILMGPKPIPISTTVHDGVFINNCSISHGCQIGSFSNLDGCVLNKNVIVGNFSKLSKGCSIGLNCVIGNNTIMNSNSKIVNYSIVGEGVYIGFNSLIGTEYLDYLPNDNTFVVRIYDEASIGSKNVIYNGCIIGNKSTTGFETTLHRDVTIGKNVRIGDNSSIGTKSTISDSAEIGSLVSIGSFAFIKENVKIGNAVRIGNSCNIGENSVIMDGAEIDDFMIIEPNSVIEKGSAITNPNKPSKLVSESQAE